MSEAQPERRSRSLPPWVMVLVLLLTAGFTVWAMSMTGFKGPAAAWDQAHDVVDGVWGQEHDPGVPQIAGWGLPTPLEPGAAKQVAGLPGVPPIIAGVRAPHADRGVCTSCHSVLSPQSLPIPSITSTSTMTHEYRGVCSNCHQLAVSGALPAARMTAAAAPTPGPAEAEWLGLEVAPSSGGVVVKGVEGLGARRGVLANDLVSSINGVAISSMQDFVRVTQNGALTQGALIVSRAGQRLAFELAPSTPPLTIAPSPAFGATPSFQRAPAAQEAQF